LVWEATCTYSSSRTALPAGAPEDQPTVYTWGSEPRTVTFDYFAGVPKNTAGDLFVPTLEGVVQDLTLNVSRNELSFDATTLKGYLNTINSVAFTVAGYSAPLSTCLIKSITGTSKLVDGVEYWEVQYSLVFRQHDPSWLDDPDTPFVVSDNAWKRRVLNAGYRELDGGVLKKMIVNGAPTEIPLLLNAAGAREPDTARAIWLPFIEYASANHATLML